MLGQGRVALVTQVSSAEVRVGPPGRGGSEPVLSEGLSQSPRGWGESSRQKDCVGQRPYRGAVSGLLEEEQGGWGGAKVE